MTTETKITPRSVPELRGRSAAVEKTQLVRDSIREVTAMFSVPCPIAAQYIANPAAVHKTYVDYRSICTVTTVASAAYLI